MLWKLSSSTCVTVLIVHCTIPSMIENLSLDWDPGPLWLLRPRVRDVSCCDARCMAAETAVGCLDVRRPDDAWMRRIDADQVEIGCYMSRQVWVLRCVDNQFVGVIGNCTQRQSNGLQYVHPPRPYIYMRINFSNNERVYMAPNKVLRCAIVQAVKSL